MSGYYHECPSCSKVTPIERKPLVWFDVNQVDPRYFEKLMQGDVRGVPVYKKDAVGEVQRFFPYPDRTCDDCGKDGCVDCIPGEVCLSCEEHRREIDTITSDEEDAA